MNRVPRVLIVSKPFGPPWNDSSKNLAREIVTHSKETEFVVLGADSFQLQTPRVRVERLFQKPGKYQPSFFQNLLTFLRLLKRDKDIDIYHFFYAPNRFTSTVLKLLMKLKRQKAVHTVCSRPYDFKRIRNLLVSNTVVAVSEETQRQMLAHNIPKVVKIGPCVSIPTEEEVASPNLGGWEFLREGTEAVILYPGDYEFSGGHEALLRSIPEVLKKEPTVRFVFACRRKTAGAAKIEEEVRTRLRELGVGDRVVLVNEVDDMYSLIRACDLVVFPAKSLYRKMDIPLTLLEALALERPLIVSDLAPLRELVSEEVGFMVHHDNTAELTERILRLTQDKALRAEFGRKGRERVKEKFNPEEVAAEYESLYREVVFGADLRRSQAYYDQFSAWYEERRRDGYHALIDDLQTQIVKEHCAGQSLLEVGSGTGLIMERLHSESTRLIGIDPSRGMVEKANSKGFRTFQASATALPFQDETFDTTYSFKVLAHVPEIESALKEMVRVTRRGGTVIAEFYNRQSFRWLRWTLRKHLFHGKTENRQIKEKEVYTRYESIREMKAHLPENLELVATKGVMIWSPFAFLYQVPVISNLLAFLETKCVGGSFRRLGGFFILVCKRRS